MTLRKWPIALDEADWSCLYPLQLLEKIQIKINLRGKNVQRDLSDHFSKNKTVFFIELVTDSHCITIETILNFFLFALFILVIWYPKDFIINNHKLKNFTTILVLKSKFILQYRNYRYRYSRQINTQAFWIFF